MKGLFKNYVDKILTIFDYLPTSTWTFFTLNVDKKKHFLTTYPPHLVHVVFERPLNLHTQITNSVSQTMHVFGFNRAVGRSDGFNMQIAFIFNEFGQKVNK